LRLEEWLLPLLAGSLDGAASHSSNLNLDFGLWLGRGPRD
jgi:hypothetical protein